MTGKSVAGVASELLTVRVEFRGSIYTENLAVEAAVTSDIAGVNLALIENPGLFAKWAMLEAFARAQYEELKEQMDRKDAELYQRYQDELMVAEPGPGVSVKRTRPTVDAIRAAVETNKDRMNLADRVQKAKNDFEQVQVGRRTIEMRRDSLITVSSNLRAEMEMSLSVGRNRLQDMRAEAAARGKGALPPDVL